MNIAKNPSRGSYDLVGVGLYSVSEASRLTEIPTQRISRWLRGYAYVHNDEVHRQPALWSLQAKVSEGFVALTFSDLMEIRFVDAFRHLGVSLPIIRKTLVKAREVFHLDFPFSSRRFSTDGKIIFAEIAKEENEPVLLDILNDQYESRRLVSQSLYATLDFDESSQAARWWPLGKQRPIVVDPARSFGQPIEASSGIPTVTLADAAKAEGSISAAAAWYGVRQAAVRASVAFEAKLAARGSFLTITFHTDWRTRYIH